CEIEAEASSVTDWKTCPPEIFSHLRSCRPRSCFVQRLLAAKGYIETMSEMEFSNRPLKGLPEISMGATRVSQDCRYPSVRQSAVGLTPNVWCAQLGQCSHAEQP